MTTEDKQAPSHWSEDGQIFFNDNFGWGLTTNLKTIPLGKEDDIRGFFETGKLNDDLKPIQRQVLNEIVEYRKELGFNGTGKGNMVRAGDDGIVGDTEKTNGLLTQRKRLPMRSYRTKNKGLSTKRSPGIR